MNPERYHHMRVEEWIVQLMEPLKPWEKQSTIDMLQSKLLHDPCWDTRSEAEKEKAWEKHMSFKVY